MMAEIGARKMASEAMNVNREAAEEMIFQGTMTQPPITVVMIAPRRRLIYLGKRVVCRTGVSAAGGLEFAVCRPLINVGGSLCFLPDRLIQN